MGKIRAPLFVRGRLPLSAAERLRESTARRGAAAESASSASSGSHSRAPRISSAVRCLAQITDVREHNTGSDRTMELL